MGYIYGPKKNAIFSFPVGILEVETGELAVDPEIVAGDWKRSIGGGAFAALANTPTKSPSGGRQIIISLEASENPGPFTTVQFVDQTDPKAYHDNSWCVIPTVAGSGSGDVLTISPTAVLDYEATAAILGPYLTNYLINALEVWTSGEKSQVLDQTAILTAIKAKTDLLNFTGTLVQGIIAGIDSTRQTLIKDLVHASGSDVGHTISQLPVGALPVTPTPHQLQAALYMMLRNGTETTGSGSSGTRNIRQADGTVVAVADISKSSGSVDTGFLDT